MQTTVQIELLFLSSQKDSDLHLNLLNYCYYRNLIKSNYITTLESIIITIKDIIGVKYFNYTFIIIITINKYIIIIIFIIIVATIITIDHIFTDHISKC